MAKKPEPNQEIQTKQFTFNIGDMYSIDTERMKVNITDKKYSTHFYIQSGQDEIIIDFLQLPGTKNLEGDFIIDGTRIFFTRENATKLKNIIEELLIKTSNSN